MAHHKVAGTAATHVDLAHDVIQGDFERDAAALSAPAEGHAAVQVSNVVASSEGGSKEAFGGPGKKDDKLSLSLPSSKSAGGVREGVSAGGSSEASSGGLLPHRITTTEDNKVG